MVVHVIKYSPGSRSIETLKAIGWAIGLCVAKRTAKCVSVLVVVWSRDSCATVHNYMCRGLGPILTVHTHTRINYTSRCSYTLACCHYSPQPSDQRAKCHAPNLEYLRRKCHAPNIEYLRRGSHTFSLGYLALRSHAAVGLRCHYLALGVESRAMPLQCQSTTVLCYHP